MGHDTTGHDTTGDDTTGHDTIGRLDALEMRIAHQDATIEALDATPGRNRRPRIIDVGARRRGVNLPRVPPFPALDVIALTIP